jgi:hypothetical protein
VPLDLPTPAHERLVADLLAWDAPRPVADPALRDELAADLEAGLAPLGDRVPDGDRLFLSKSRLTALVCDGRYLDQRDSPFTWSLPLAGGKLAHRAIELDQATRRGAGPDEVVDHAWHEMATDRGSLADWLNGLTRVEAAALRHTAEQRVTDFRDTWPVLPPQAHLRLEQRIDATFADGRVLVSGTPDLTVGGVRDDRARMLLVDLKTGRRNPVVERQDLRLYALLATLKYGVPPFRWATYYVSEGAWDVEDLDPALLRGAVRRVVDAAARAAELDFHRPADDELRLVGGSWCRYCGRRPGCPAAPEDPYGDDASWGDIV